MVHMELDLHIRQRNPLDKAMLLAWQKFDCAPLGGMSQDGWSLISDLQRCPYRYYLRHEQHMRMPATSSDDDKVSALDVGSLTHAVLALHYCRYLPEGYPGYRSTAPCPGDYLDAVQTFGGDPRVVLEVERLYGGYCEQYSTEVVTPVAVEYGAGVVGHHTCRYDMLAWRDGALWIYEHKTLSREDIDPWWLDGEIIGQLYAWQLANKSVLFGAAPVGVCINMLIKKRPAQYRRIDVVIPQKVVDRYTQDRAWWADMRNTCRETGTWPKALGGCRGVYGLCEYHAHCRDEDNSLLAVR